MKVVREEIDATRVQRLVVTEPQGSDHHAGECIGYLCSECRQVDETLDQIWHEPECSLAGEHGRTHYDELDHGAAGGPTPEFDPDNEFIVIKAAETEGRGGLHEAEVLAFICTCGNADEDLFEIVHDEACPLANQGQSEDASASTVPTASLSDSPS